MSTLFIFWWIKFWKCKIEMWPAIYRLICRYGILVIYRVIFTFIDELRWCLGALWCGLCETVVIGLKLGRTEHKSAVGTYRSGLIKQHIHCKYHQKKIKEQTEIDFFINENSKIHENLSQTHRSDVFFVRKWTNRFCK